MHSTTGVTPDLGEDTVMRTVHQKISNALKPTRLQVVPTYDDANGSQSLLPLLVMRLKYSISSRDIKLFIKLYRKNLR